MPLPTAARWVAWTVEAAEEHRSSGSKGRQPRYGRDWAAPGWAVPSWRSSAWRVVILAAEASATLPGDRG